MKLSDFGDAASLVERLRIIDEHIAEVMTFLGVTLHGRYYDELNPVVRPALLAHFGEQRKAVLAELAALGIT